MSETKKLKTKLLKTMEKKGQKTIYDLDLSEILETKPTIEQRLPDFMLFMQKNSQLDPKRNYRTCAYNNQTWSIPGRTYQWFPYYKMYVTSK